MGRIAAIQMCSTDSLDENLAEAKALIQQAADQGAEVVVLPEMFVGFFSDPQEKLRIQEKEGEGKIQDFFAEQARQNKVWIFGGTIPMQGDDLHRFKAACLVFDPSGQRVGRYDKIHLFDADVSGTAYRESDLTEPGYSATIVDTPIGKIGIAVCFDIRFPLLFSQLFLAGAEIIVIPTAFTVKTGEAHWELLARARAVDTFSYVVGACQGGKHKNGRVTYGHSLIVDPWGSVVAGPMDDQPGLICADIDLQQLYQVRKDIPIKNQDGRPHQAAKHEGSLLVLTREIQTAGEIQENDPAEKKTMMMTNKR